MLCTKVFALALAFAPSVFAAPTVDSISSLERRALSPETIHKLQDGNCDLSKAVMPIGTSTLLPISQPHP